MTAPCEHCAAHLAAWLEQRADAHDADAAHLDAHPPAPRAPGVWCMTRNARWAKLLHSCRFYAWRRSISNKAVE